MRGLPDETVVQILAALPYMDIATTVAWAAVDEAPSSPEGSTKSTSSFDTVASSSAVAGARGSCCLSSSIVILLRFAASSSSSAALTKSIARAFGGRAAAVNPEANAWRTLEWPRARVVACCATEAVVVTFSSIQIGDWRLRSLRPGSAEGWVSIPDPPAKVINK